ncbi:hypothetical protein ScPMuIL_010784 [Solemya velum]
MAAPLNKMRTEIVCRLCGKISRSFVHRPLLRCQPKRHLRKHNNQSREKWKGVVGLEIHAQIATSSKLFSGSATHFGAPTNTQVSFFDAALPGTLPVLNRGCVEASVLTALALGCDINRVSKFDRKHYFYADLPAGYQITQQRQPIARLGKVQYVVYDPAVNKYPVQTVANLTQLQLEQDSGKSLHDTDEGQSLIDLNRAGVGLMEIVTEPEFTSGEDAASFIKELQLILQVLGTCDGKMAEGSLRVDANISVHKQGEPLGVRTEVKNLNSIRSVAKAIEFEIERQICELERGRSIANETRSFDPEAGETVPMRDKEKILDYRFMPEPNLPPLHLYDDKSMPEGVKPSDVISIDAIQKRLPELPNQMRERLQGQHGLTLLQAALIVSEEGLVRLFDDVICDSKRNPQTVANFLSNEYLSLLNKRDVSVIESPVRSAVIGEVCDMLENSDISLKIAKRVIEEVFDDPSQSAADVVRENDWRQITDEEELEKLCQQIISDHPQRPSPGNKIKSGQPDQVWITPCPDNKTKFAQEQVWTTRQSSHKKTKSRQKDYVRRQHVEGRSHVFRTTHSSGACRACYLDIYFTLFPLTAQTVSCGHLWKEFQGSCYFYDYGTNTPEAANELCKETHDAHLVKITSEEENTFVGKLVSKTTLPISWIAAKRSESGEWKWIDNGENVTFKAWALKKKSVFNCAGIIYSDLTGASWVSLNCDLYYCGFVCER